MEVLEIRLLNGLTPNWIEGPETTSPQDTEPLGENLWGFISWDAIKETFGTVQNLYAVIQNIHREIRALKEKFRQFGVDFQGLALQPNLEGGTGNSYFLVDEQGKRKFVVKPLDEDTGAINSTSHTSLSSYSPLRKNVPLYRGPMREVLAYRIAQIMGLESVAPKTVFSVIQSERFHDLSEHVSPQELPRYWEQCGKPDQEKLCSVQEYVEKSQPLPEARQNLLQAGLSEEEIADRFDPEDFENVHLLLWITYDTDGHPGNFLVYPKGIDTLGNEILGLKKIDNGLAFPDSN
ncbi:MAG: hypothetical protein KGQ49_04210, partial [Verrucomicrobia bacterium]|nr:hypothetical protein [Verrucomicrobiota bacterium]